MQLHLRTNVVLSERIALSALVSFFLCKQSASTPNNNNKENETNMSVGGWQRNVSKYKNLNGVDIIAWKVVRILFQQNDIRTNHAQAHR